MKAVFLDRDGVLNQAIVKNGKPYSPANLAELIIPADVGPALQALKEAGFLLIGVTNQPDVARGVTERAVVESINKVVSRKLSLDAMLVCYHDDADNCNCRKPRPGLLLKAAEKYPIVLSESYMIGDRWRDVEAGQQAGCKTIWLDYGYNEKKPIAPDFVAVSLSEAARWILQQ